MEEDICDITLESEAYDVTLESPTDTDRSVDESFSSVELQVDPFRPICAAATLASCHSSTPKKPLVSHLQNVLPDSTIGKSQVDQLWL